MAKTVQVMKFIHHGIFTVVHHTDADINPFWLYYEANGHKHLVNKYADKASCLYYLWDIVLR